MKKRYIKTKNGKTGPLGHLGYIGDGKNRTHIFHMSDDPGVLEVVQMSFDELQRIKASPYYEAYMDGCFFR